jgi:hypothetical protein
MEVTMREPKTLCENCPEDGPKRPADYVLSIRRLGSEETFDEVLLCSKCAKHGGFALSVNGKRLECD